MWGKYNSVCYGEGPLFGPTLLKQKRLIILHSCTFSDHSRQCGRIRESAINVG